MIDRVRTTPEQIDDLRRRVAEYDTEFRCFLLMLPADENLRRVERRARTRALGERERDLEVVAREREVLFGGAARHLGEVFDVSAPPPVLVEAMLKRLGMPRG